MRIFGIFSILLAVFITQLWPQGEGDLSPGNPQADPAHLIGLELEDLLRHFGFPKSVYAVRGLEEWQDDVVFVYDEGDFYFFRDRVWKVGLKSAYLISSGDPRAAVLLSFKEAVQTGFDYAVFSLHGYNWPIAIRFNFDSAGRVTMIFIYRTDI